MGAGDQQGTGGIEVDVLSVEIFVVGGREPVEQMQVRVELDKTFAEIGLSIPASISGDKINISVRVSGRSLTGLPDTGGVAGRRRIENAGLL